MKVCFLTAEDWLAIADVDINPEGNAAEHRLSPFIRKRIRDAFARARHKPILHHGIATDIRPSDSVHEDALISQPRQRKPKPCKPDRAPLRTTFAPNIGSGSAAAAAVGTIGSSNSNKTVTGNLTIQPGTWRDPQSKLVFRPAA